MRTRIISYQTTQVAILQKIYLKSSKITRRLHKLLGSDEKTMRWTKIHSCMHTCMGFTIPGSNTTCNTEMWTLNIHLSGVSVSNSQQHRLLPQYFYTPLEHTRKSPTTTSPYSSLFTSILTSDQFKITL